jgi:UTP-glucose-1-phosphate uridylyltransferase
MKYRKLKGESIEAEATDGEMMLTEDIFDALSKIAGYMVDFSDNGNEIYLTDTIDDSCYTITVKQDE